ncbi:MAG TPA: MBL fold metallo-hydrolase [Planctomycetota bacterium]|nr:MBL fold metallo-hydrolase [Planctomycetota bacterium]
MSKLAFILLIITILCLPAVAVEITEVAPGVHFRLGDLDRGQANGGFIVCDDFTIAIEAPSKDAANEMLEEAKKISDKPIRLLIITHGHWDHDGGLDVFTGQGAAVVVHETLRQRYVEKNRPGNFLGVSDRIVLTSGERTIEVITRGTAHSPSDIFVWLPKERVLFTGDAAVSIPSAWLGECDLQNWIDTLHSVAELQPKTICPGHGPAGGPEIPANHAAYLTRLRDEVGWQITMGRTYEVALANVKLPENEKFGTKDSLKDHVKAAYTQLTATAAVDPTVPEPPIDATPRALALIGDRYHPPAYIRPPLEAAFRTIGMPVEFVYDVTKLNAQTLRGVRLLVVLRDGMIWPKPTADKPDGEAAWWMTDEQEKAIADFVRAGGGFLALHNSTALRRINDGECLYRDVLGSTYNGHGAGDEKFTVKVVNPDHPVTRGVTDYQAVDERHNPIVQAKDATILLQAISGDKTSVNGYVRAVGKGRVCHLANGHNIEMLQLPQMQQLIGNAALWCCGLRN